MPIARIDRIKIVVLAGRKRAQSRSVNADFVQVEALFVMRLVAEKHTLGVEREIGPPKAAGLSLGSQQPDVSTGEQSVEHEQPPPGHRPVAETMYGLMRPFGPLRIGLIDEQELREVDGRVAPQFGAWRDARRGIAPWRRQPIDSPAADGARALPVRSTRRANRPWLSALPIARPTDAPNGFLLIARCASGSLPTW